jgi:8-oxo-dGTP pyrophosphatase MutT (NUDIX family)
MNDMHNETVDIVDDLGNVLRQELKTESHVHGWLHKTVIGYLKYGDDWALVRQAADRQDAGQLVAPVGGHVRAGESDVEALLREAEEEIGTRNITYQYVGTTPFHRQVIGRDENHLFIVYEIQTNDPIHLGTEAVTIERFTPAGLEEALAKEPQNFGGAFYVNLEKFYPEYLPEGYNPKYID